MDTYTLYNDYEIMLQTTNRDDMFDLYEVYSNILYENGYKLIAESANRDDGYRNFYNNDSMILKQISYKITRENDKTSKIKTMEFKLSEEEQKLANEFIEEHKNHHKLGIFSYIFTPNGIGTNVYIKCQGCKEIKDITDYGCW